MFESLGGRGGGVASGNTSNFKTFWKLPSEQQLLPDGLIVTVLSQQALSGNVLPDLKTSWAELSDPILSLKTQSIRKVEDIFS